MTPSLQQHQSDRLTDDERQVVEALDADGLVADLAELVAFAAVGGSGGEVAVQRWCASRLRDLGLEVAEWDVDLATEASQPDFPGMEVERGAMVGVVGTWRPDRDEIVDGTTALVLCGHTDVVPVEDPARWRSDPFRLAVEDGALRGRGTCDMLGGVAALLAAVTRPASRRESRWGDLLPCTSSAVRRTVAPGPLPPCVQATPAQRCVIAEPTGGAVIPANAGSLTFRLEVEGRAAHGSTRTAGESALDHLAPVQSTLRELEARRNADVPEAFAHLDLAAPISIGIVRAGTWASTVPDLLVAEGRYGVLPGEPLDVARSVFEEAVARPGGARPVAARAPRPRHLAGWRLRIGSDAGRAPAARRRWSRRPPPPAG